MIQKPEALWVNVLRSKDKCGPLKFPEFKISNGGSNLWQGLCGFQRYIKEGLKWNVGNGLDVRLWLDAWVPGLRALHTYEDIVIPGNEMNLLVASYVLDGE